MIYYISSTNTFYCRKSYILLTKTTAAQNEVALSYHRVRGLYFLAVVFVATIVLVLYLYRAHVLLIDFTKIPVNLRRIYANVHLLLSLSGVIKVIYSL